MNGGMDHGDTMIILMECLCVHIRILLAMNGFANVDARLIEVRLTDKVHLFARTGRLNQFCGMQNTNCNYQERRTQQDIA